MTRRKHPEDDLHITVAQYLGVERNVALPDDAVWTTIEPGGKRGKREAGRLKSKGLKPGLPDIIVLYRGQLICFELKAPGGTLSKVQKAMHTQLTLAGAFVYPGVVTRLEQVEGFLRGAGVPLRATTGARAA